MVHVIPLSVGQRRRDAVNPVQGPGSPPGEAAQPLDDEWQALAGHYQQRQAQQQAFDTEIAARRLNGQLAQAEADAVANAAADGAGLHDAMYGQVDPRTGQVVKTGLFDTLFDDFVKQAPAELRPGFANRKAALREAGSIRMALQQNQRRRDYEQAEVDTALKTGAIAIGNADPDDHVTFEAARQEGLDLIDRMGVDPGIRQQMAKDWFGTAAKARFEALIARDPQRALAMFGVGASGQSFGKAADDRLGKKALDETQAFGGNAPAPDRFADLSPDDVQLLINQAHAANTAQLIEARSNIALASQNASDAIAKTGSYSGNIPSPADFAGIYGAEEGGKQYRDLSLNLDVGRQAFDMRTMPNQAIHAALRDAEPGSGSSNEEQTRYQVTAAAALKTLGMRRTDPAGYVREVFPNVDAAWSAATSPDNKPGNGDAEAYKWAIAVSVAAQRQLGVENPQPLPGAVVQSVFDTLSNNDVPEAEKQGILPNLLAAASDPGVREALSRQLDQARLVGRPQIDPIVTAATGRPPPAPPGEARLLFQQAAEDFGDYLSESFEALGRVPHDIGLFLRDLRDDPLDALSQLPVTPASGATAGGAAGLRWFGANSLKAGKIADEVTEPALRAFSKNYRKTFFKEYPELIGMVLVHHRIEQRVLKRYVGIISDEMMHSLENLRGIPTQLNSTLHLSTIRREWDAFYRQNPTTTMKKLLEKAAEIDDKYGHLFNPPIGKK